MVDAVLDPLFVTLVLLAVLLVILVRRRERTGLAPVALCAAALLVLGIASNRPISAAFLELLESGQEHLDPAVQPAPDAILVLGAGLRETTTPRPVLGDAGKERLLEGIRLAQAYPEAMLVFSGGIPAREITSGGVMAAWASRVGVDPARVLAEENATNTRENAANLAAMASDRGWSRVVVVTSARHMPRSLAAFRAVGLDPVPAPCDFTALGPLRGWLSPDPVAVGNTQRFLHEVVGRVWYRLRGWV